MIVGGYIVNINVVCTVNIRDHEANFCEAEIEAEARKIEAEAEWRPRGLNIPVDNRSMRPV